MKFEIVLKTVGTMAKQNAPVIIVGGLLITCVMISPTYGVTLEALKAPIQALKTNVFNGWMMPVQIIGLAASGLLSFAKQSMLPLGIGVGSVIGINFFDGYL